MNAERKIIIFFGWIFIFFCFFPYLSVLRLSTTTQPNALLLSIFPILLVKSKLIPKEIFALGAVFVFSTLVLIVSDLNFLSFRDWANYLSLFFISFGAYKFLRYVKGLPYRFFYIVVLTWLFVGLVQTLVYQDFLSFAVHGMRGGFSDGRGVAGISGEPTYYGLMMGLFFVTYMINKWYERSRFLGFIILFQLFFISRSSTGIVIFVMASMLFTFILLMRLNLRVVLSVIAFSIALSTVGVLTINLYENSRIYSVVKAASSHPEKVLALDLSISERVNHVIFPIVGMIEGAGRPRGYGEFNDYLLAKMNDERYDVFFAHPLSRGSSRILSGHGKGYFELGFVGLLISFSIFSAFRFKFIDLHFLFGFILYFLLLFMALPFMTATVPFIIGNVLYIRHESNNTVLASSSS